jgi:GNAT superfamily N-acetyltransferase
VASYPFSDLDLARRLEHAEARANAAFVDARAALEPHLGATWIEVAGALAMFDGPTSPVTQTFGLGLFEPVDARHLDRIESFFDDRGAPVCHEISPLAGVVLMRALGDRGYHPVELTSVMCRPIALDDEIATHASRVAVEIVNTDRGELWAATAAQGWSHEPPDIVDFVRGLGRVGVRTAGRTAFLATLDDRPIAAASLSVHDGIALLAGASTIPSARRQGAQEALLRARLRYAGERGCALAMMGAAPGSASQRNAERRGFRVAYTRIKWERREA